MPVNATWHRAHPMPPRATERQRAEWHLEHARECACREIPPPLRAQMVGWGMLPAEQSTPPPAT